MPDVAAERYRVTYLDAFEVKSEAGDVVGVATFPVDTTWDGTPTGERDPLPIRVYSWVPEDDDEPPCSAYLSLEDAEELVEVLQAAIEQVRWSRDRLRVSPYAVRP